MCVCVPMHKHVLTYSVNMCIYAHTCVFGTHACIMCMWSCACMCLYSLWIYMCVFLCTHFHTHLSACMWEHTDIYANTHLHIVYAHVWTCVFMFVWIYRVVHAYVTICKHLTMCSSAVCSFIYVACIYSAVLRSKNPLWCQSRIKFFWLVPGNWTTYAE